MISKGTDLYTIESAFYSFKKALLPKGCVFNQDLCDKAFNEGCEWAEQYKGNVTNYNYAQGLALGLFKFIDLMYKEHNKGLS